MTEEQIEEQIEEQDDLVKIKQQERQIRKGNKKKNALRGFMRFLTFVGILAGVYYCLTFRGWYLPQNAFSDPNSKRVFIENNKIVKTAKIRSMIKNVAVPRTPIFLTSLRGLRKQLLALPPVESVYIRRYAFPARVLIIVREGVPYISVSPNESSSPVAVFTKDGKLIMGADYLPLPAECKTVKVLAISSNNDDFRKWDKNKLEQIEKIVKYVESCTSESVEYLDMRIHDDIYVKTKTVTVRLGQPDDDIYSRIERLPSILPQIKDIKNKVKYIDVSWEKVSFLKMK